MTIQDAWTWHWRSEREKDVWAAVGFVIRDREVYWLDENGGSIIGYPYPAGTRETKLWELLVNGEKNWAYSEDAIAVNVVDGPHLDQTVACRQGESILFLSDDHYGGVAHTYLVDDRTNTARYLGKRAL